MSSDATVPLTDGFHLVIDALKLNGIDTIYGVPGIPITDLGRMMQADGMRVIAFRHEQPAGYAASIAGYLTRKPGVCLTVSAPGFLNGLIALAHATTNCFPMILISGSSEREIVDLMQGDYEEMDQLAVAKSVCKAAFRVARRGYRRWHRARHRAAVSGRPGGVYLDLPSKLFGQRSTQPRAIVADQGGGCRAAANSVARIGRSRAGAAEGRQEAADHPRQGRSLRASRRGHPPPRRATGIPFLPMSMAKGLLPDNHPQSASAARSMVLKDADVVMLIGARLNWLLSHGKGKTWGARGTQKFIHVDIAATEMDSNVGIDAPVVGDIASVVSVMLSRTGDTWAKPAAWANRCAPSRRERRQDGAAAQEQQQPDGLSRCAGRAARDHQAAAGNDPRQRGRQHARLRTFDHRHLPAAQAPRRRHVGHHGHRHGLFGRRRDETGKQVLTVCGDSAFGFSGMEIETICRYKLPVCVVVFNNNGIYRGTDTNPGGDDPAWTTFTKDAHYDLMAKAFGGNGVRATSPSELTAAVNAAIDSRQPTLINAIIDEKAGTESGRIGNLNPQSVVGKKA